jgi:hypothetical protein
MGKLRRSLQITSRNDLMCEVEKLEYPVKTRTGKLVLPEGYSANGDGVTRLFEDIDAEVACIDVFSGTEPEFRYRRDVSGWQVFDLVSRARK